jgi:serine protease Do
MNRAKIKYLVVSLILILSLTLGASCTLIPSDWLPPPADGGEPSPPAVEAPPPAPATTPPSTTPIEPEWTSPPRDSDALRLPDYTAVVAKVKPWVVTIKTDAGEGSGWIIDEDGIIVTNSHVVAGAETVTITLDDGRTFPAEAVCTDPLTDLAVVKIDTQNLPVASIGDSDKLRVGEQVAAIGNPLGLGVSMKGGWISRLEVSIPAERGQTLGDLIETDAAINPGNSGGPLVDMAGEVIGITSAKIAMVGVEGMGYAISINTAIPIIDQLILNGYVIRPYLGVRLADVNPTLVWWYQLPVDKGAFVTYVAPDSPAAEAGIEPEDIIVSLNDKEIATAEELIQAIHSVQIGQRVKIVFWRGDTENTSYATLTESPPPEQ